MCEEDVGILGNDGITRQSQIYFGEKSHLWSVAFGM